MVDYDLYSAFMHSSRYRLAIGFSLFVNKVNNHSTLSEYITNPDEEKSWQAQRRWHVFSDVVILDLIFCHHQCSDIFPSHFFTFAISKSSM